MKGCELIMPKALDLTNQIFGDFKVLEKIPSRNKKTYWLCECQRCKRKKEIQTSHLTRNEIKNCNCSPRYKQIDEKYEDEKKCILCQSLFKTSNKSRKYCYNCSPSGINSAESLKLKKRALKHYLITIKGGQCQNCGYSKCEGALQFHHRDPSLKEFNFSHINLNENEFSLEKILLELDKCDLLCANCHFEEHYGKD